MVRPGERRPIVLFGAGTPSGAALLSAATPRPVLAAGRQRPWLPASGTADFLPADLGDPAGVPLPEEEHAWISFAPIWLLAPFLERLRQERPGSLSGLRAVVACSSSSRLTKRFAANRYDRELVARLRQAEASLEASCDVLGIPCRILAPTLIYGEAGRYGDRNLSLLLAWMRRLPVLPVPADSGLRQPIHARQLAAVALTVLERLEQGAPDAVLPRHLPLGGDETLSYRAMLERLRDATPPGDPARRCRLLAVPPRLLLWLAQPLLLVSPRRFEAIQRMQADLAGFTPAHELLGGNAEVFPVPPLRLP